MPDVRRLTIPGVVACIAFASVAPVSAQRGQGPPPQAQAPPPLQFRYVGPASSGRVSAVAGIPGDTMTYYAGAASGGIWKTTDGAKTFTPIFDAQRVQAIGALAVAPSDPKTVWAGTGEAWAIRPSDVIGDGIYKSTDAGATWKHAGLKETGRIARILVHPTNPQIVFVCALGRATGPQQERGVYRSTNGGDTWDRVLFVNGDTGCSGISMDAKDPNVLIAGTWQVVMHTWAMFSGGPGSNRAIWDLRYDGPQQVVLRSTPPDNPHIWEEARFKGQTTRPIEHWGIQQPQRIGPIAAPGKYTVKLAVEGQTFTQAFEVLKDPAIPSADEDLIASTKAQIRIRDDMNQAVAMINALEVVRRQIEDQLKESKGAPALVKALSELDAKVLDAELHLVSRTDLHSDDKWYVETYKVYMNLVWHSGVVGTGAGDVAGGADYRPTDASLKVLEGIEKDLAAAKLAYDNVVQREIPGFNTAFAGKAPEIKVR